MPAETPGIRRYVPWQVLVSLILVAAGVLSAGGRFTAETVNDTPSYADFDFSTWSSALGQMRSPGYPLLLAAVRAITGNYAAMPVVHFLLFGAGVALLHAGLLAQGFSRAASPWIAGATLAAMILSNYVATLATDTTAAAFGLAACGTLLVWTSVPRSAAAWALLLTLAVVAAWLVRPTMLSLVPFVCICGPLLELRRLGHTATLGGLAWRFAMCAAITVTPVLVWCGLRYSVVGKFGVVSFGGYNLIGLAGQFLDDDLLPRLPHDLQPLAKAALERRASLPQDSIQLAETSVLRYSRIEANYDLTIWKCFAPAAEELYGRDATVLNSRLKDLALAVLRLRPGWYATWILRAGGQAVRGAAQEFAANPATCAITVAAVLAAFARIIKRWRNPQKSQTSGEMTPTTMLFVLAICYAACNLALVIVVCPPIGRMTASACVLFPALAAAVLADCLGDLTGRAVE